MLVIKQKRIATFVLCKEPTFQRAFMQKESHRNLEMNAIQEKQAGTGVHSFHPDIVNHSNLVTSSMIPCYNIRPRTVWKMWNTLICRSSVLSLPLKILVVPQQSCHLSLPLGQSPWFLQSEWIFLGGRGCIVLSLTSASLTLVWVARSWFLRLRAMSWLTRQQRII